MHVSHLARAGALALLLSGTRAAPAAAQQDAPSTDTLTLDAAIARALATHPRIGAAGQAIRAARGGRLTARSWTNPTLTYQAEKMPAAMPGGAMEEERMTFAMVPLEPFYQRWPRSAQASAEVRAAEAELAVTRRAVALDAAAAYVEASSAQVSVSALLDVRSWLDSLVGYTRARVREGAAAEVDLIRLEVEQGRTRTDLAMARVDLARAHARLASLIGTGNFAIAAPVDTLVGQRAVESRDSLVGRAMRQRPELLAADARVAAARSGVSVERSRILREVGVMAGLKTTSGTRTLMTGLSVPLPLFDQNRGEIRRADAQRRIAEFAREMTVRDVTAETEASYAAVATLTEQLSSMRDGLLRRAEEARRIAEAAYREGAVPLVQVLDAARALAEARQVYFRALLARQQSMLELNAAIGDAVAPTTPGPEDLR